MFLLPTKFMHRVEEIIERNKDELEPGTLGGMLNTPSQL